MLLSWHLLPCDSSLQVSINMLRYGLGRSQSVPLQLGLAAAIRAAATASPATAVAAVDFMRYTESHLAEALAERHSSSADRCIRKRYQIPFLPQHVLVRAAMITFKVFYLALSLQQVHLAGGVAKAVCRAPDHPRRARPLVGGCCSG